MNLENLSNPFYGIPEHCMCGTCLKIISLHYRVSMVYTEN